MVQVSRTFMQAFCERMRITAWLQEHGEVTHFWITTRTGWPLVVADRKTRDLSRRESIEPLLRTITRAYDAEHRA